MPARKPDAVATDHSTTLVPLEAWAYQSPHLAGLGRRTELGGVAEALVYYDRVLLNVQSPDELTDLFDLFAEAGKLDTLTSMLRDGTLRLCHFAFINDPLQRVGPDGKPFGPLLVLNAQTQEQGEPGWIDRALLNPLPLDRWFDRARHRQSVLRALREGCIEVKADDFGAAVSAAVNDLQDPRRAALFVQALVDDSHELLGLGRPPEVTAVVSTSGDLTNTAWNVNLPALGARIGHPKLADHTVLRAAATANRLLWMAARQRCDLFVGSPLGQLLGDKLEEVCSTADKPQRIIQNLEAKVEFPDVRELVNRGALPVSEVMRLRSHSSKFRRWLQTESEHDRDAIIAYHNEVAKAAGFSGFIRKTLRFFSVPGGAVVATVAGGVVQHHTGDPALAANTMLLAGSFSKHLLDKLSRSGEEWKPVVFGKWATARIEKYLRKAGKVR